MKTGFKLVLLATAVLSIVILCARLSRACGPFFPKIIFTNTLHPDLPIWPFTMGELGVVEPTYSSIYLYVAYHNLVGLHFAPADETALWDHDPRLLTGEGIWPAELIQKQQAEQADARTDWLQKWEAATGQSLESVPISYGRISLNGFNYQPWAGIYNKAALHASWGLYYSQYLNCPQGAFHYAIATLQGLSLQFGKTSPVVKEWVQAQEAVFGDCSGGNGIPSPLPSSAPAIAHEARAYQIAAAHFYSGDYDQAAAQFHAIAHDTSSPWRTIAPYLVARSLVRKATMVETPGVNLAALAQADAQVDSVLSNPRLSRYHHAAEQLRGFIDFRLHPRQRLVELANHLTRPSGDPNLAQDATDFRLLFPQVEQRPAYRTPPPISNELYTDLGDVWAKSDLLDWMFTMRLGGPEAYTHSLEKWESTHSQTWLVAALTKAAPDSANLSELLAWARHIPPGDPAYDSVTFQSLRLMVLQGHRNAVRERLARLDFQRLLVSGFGRTPRSAVNLFLALRFELAQNLDELFANAPRVPAMIADSSENGDIPAIPYPPFAGISFTKARFDGDALIVFNRFLPVTMLAKAVRSSELPENLRHQIAVAAWTRAALLGMPSVARALAPSVETFEPELIPSVKGYNKATTPAGRHFALVLAALRFPGLSPFIITTPDRTTPLREIGDYRNNWWGTLGPVCAPPNPYTGKPGYPAAPQWPQVGSIVKRIYSGGRIRPPQFLTTKERIEGAREWQRLIGLGPAPDYLASGVIAWAEAYPSDPRVPEALALAVRSTRFGCADRGTGKLSKAAFDLLHSRYPNSSWAKKTAYWFKM
ncbi:MAG: hypothetical protein ACRD06_00720 [Terriglobia bacterium]